MVARTSHPVVDLGRAGNRPLLTAEEERLLAWRIQRRKGDPDARRKLVEANLRLVFLFAREFTNKGLPLEDLVVEGQAGLVLAADRFDPRQGTRFSTYAKWWIRLAMRRAVQNQARLVRVPVRTQDVFYRYCRERGDEEDVEAAALRLGENPEFLRRAIEATNLQAVELDIERPHGEHHDVADAVEEAADLVRFEAAWKKMRRLLPRLPRIQRRVLEMRFGLKSGEPLDYREIGRRLKVEWWVARQLEREGLGRLREWIGVGGG